MYTVPCARCSFPNSCTKSSGAPDPPTYRLNVALSRYEPLFIIPMLQSTYILCATVSGGVYFQEFEQLSYWNCASFTLGIAIMLIGLYLITPTREGTPRTDLKASVACLLRPRRRADPDPNP